MAECDVSGYTESEPQKSETKEFGRWKTQWGSRPCQVATVRPMARNGDSETSGLHAARSSSPAHPSSQLNSSSPRASHPVFITQSRQVDRLQQQPFSFDQRDSLQRVAREMRLDQLREESLLDSRFRANPVRRYKPLVLKQSTRPLTVPRSPFTRMRRANT